MPSPSTFPDTDEGLGSTRPRSFSVNGTVADAESRVAMSGVRVDLQAIAGGILATAFTGSNGNFQFNNVRLGNYELIFDEPGYEDRRESGFGGGLAAYVEYSVHRLFHQL